MSYHSHLVSISLKFSHVKHAVYHLVITIFNFGSLILENIYFRPLAIYFIATYKYLYQNYF